MPSPLGQQTPSQSQKVYNFIPSPLVLLLFCLNVRCFFSGCKFSAEEERTVIELQAEFGNKWARIATHLPGRTDNDVKNFWSSRVKRLARILHNSSDASTSPKPPSRRNKGKIVKPIQYFYPPQVYYVSK